LETKEDIFRLVIDEVAPASLAEPTLADLLSLIGLQATE
jgi:hypothetical protein